MPEYGNDGIRGNKTCILKYGGIFVSRNLIVSLVTRVNSIREILVFALEAHMAHTTTF